MRNADSFMGNKIRDGILFDLSNNKFPSIVYGFLSEEFRGENQTSTTYGYIFKGNSTLKYNGLSFPLLKGMFFSAPGKFVLSGGEGILIEYSNYRGFFQIGGVIEKTGRLKYINGCTDSLLINPIRKGDPCLNTLYFPKGIDQTAHTHPSYRIGLIIEGSGECITPQARFSLAKGMAFVIHDQCVHSFKTYTGKHMNVLSFHPDSDFGPEDENHPMINRTIVDGKSANKVSEILTS